MPFWDSEEKKQRAAAKEARKLAEERRRAEEARVREMQARAEQKNMKQRAKAEQASHRAQDADRRLSQAEQRLATEKRARMLHEAQQAERDEQKKSREAYRAKHPGFYNPNLRMHSIFVVALSLLAIFISISFLLQEQVGAIGGAVAHGLLGCFSFSACLIPIFMLVHAALWRHDVRERLLVPKALVFIPVLLLTAALSAILSPGFDPAHFNGGVAYANGQHFVGGGVIGEAIGFVLHRMIGLAGTVMVTVVIYIFFIALYARTQIYALYTKAQNRIKAYLVEQAKARDARRATRKQEKEEIAIARREEKHKQNLARVRGEDSHGKPAPARSTVEQHPDEEPARLPKGTPLQKPSAPSADARERIAFYTEQPEKDRATQPEANWNERRLAEAAAEREALRREKTERRRSLFLDLEQNNEIPAVAPRLTDDTDFSAIREGMRQTAVSAAVTYDGEVDFADIRHGKATPVAGHAPAHGNMMTGATTGGQEMRPSAASAGHALPSDPMVGPMEDGFDPLPIANQKVRAVRVSQEEAEIPSEPLPEKEPKRGLSAITAPLTKLFRRAQEKAIAEKTALEKKETESEPVVEETPAGHDMAYFRRITVTAGETNQVGHDQPFLHPDITPLPNQEAPTRPRTAVHAFVADTVEGTHNTTVAETTTDQGTDIIVENDMNRTQGAKMGTEDNPFHPRNNPSYKTETEGRPKPRYDGVPGSDVFTPSSRLKDDLAAAQKVQAAEKPQAAPTPTRGRIVQEKIDMSARPAPKPYQFPPLSLLHLPEAVDEGNITAEVQSNAEILVTTLDSFKVRSRVTGYSRGPRITRYEVVPDAGIRVRTISNLVDDISMALAAPGVRIEAPIPGKSAVGIEVPNSSPTLVRLRGMLDCEKFRTFAEKTMVCLGSDVTGQPVYCDLAKMPHLLVAGATGMGKSVCINSIITSILYKASPDDVKLIMIDPKKVEFGIYAGIPHLLVPVVTDPKKAAGALSWAVNEMERRFGLIEQAGVRDIKGYNRYTQETGDGEPLPRIMIIIDELHDLMMSAADAVETSIARIAAKARAAGIHLLIGTQRPSVDVITGTIKANIPSRIAFHVSSQVDSRTILDFAGAEKLLAHGDMLYAPAGMSKPLRVQGSFVDDKEIDRVVSFLKSNNECDNTAGEEIMADIEREAEKCVPQKKSGEEGGTNIPTDDDDNHLLWAALEIGFEYGKLATSLLQRKLSVGYGKAAKILDALQDMGCVSAPDGSRPREILITREEFKEMMARGVQEKCGNNFS